MTTRTPRSLLPLAIVLAMLTACSSTASPSPAPTASPSVTASVAPSLDASPAPSPTATALPSTPSPTASAGPSIPAVADGWQLVWPNATKPRLILSTVIATAAGFVAVGADVPGQKPAAISSSDGVTWMSEAITGDLRSPASLATWGDRLLAVGTGGANCAHPAGLDTWVRSAAGHWTEAPFTDLLCQATDVRIAFVGSTAVLVGSGPGDNPVVWSSSDGLHWADHSQAFAGILPKAVVSDGKTAVLFAEGPTATWSSSTSNGSTWTAPAALPGLPGGLTIDGAFRIDGQPTIVASVGGVLGTIRSNGSGSWDTTAASGLTADDLGSISQFAGGLLAVGGNGTGAAAWVSSNGASWRPLSLPPALAVDGASVGAVAVRDGRAILVGTVPAGIDNAASSIWTGSADLLAP
jgi:hypothetical protein